MKRMRNVVVLLTLVAMTDRVICRSASVAHQHGRSVGANQMALVGTLPLSFERNEGQADQRVQFLARTRHLTVLLTATEAILTVPQSPSAVLRMQLVGASSTAMMHGIEGHSGVVNYYHGRNPRGWHLQIPTYAKVRSSQVYPGVDVVYYADDKRRLEHDFIVHAGADPKRIVLAFQGAERLQVDARGNLILETAVGPITLRKPHIYQERHGIKTDDVAGGYQLLDDRHARFQIAQYDTSRTLVIDPVIVYSTYLGGSGRDGNDDVAVGTDGAVYVTGSAASGFPLSNPWQSEFGGGSSDIVIAKLDPEGSTFIYSTYIGGNGSGVESSQGIAVDSAGNAYVAGRTSSTDFPTKHPLQEVYGGGPADAVLLKLDPKGQLIYSSYLGGSGQDVSSGIAIDQNGNAYVTGSTDSPNFPTKNAVQSHLTGQLDAFVTKVNVEDSVLAYSTYLGGSWWNAATAIRVDAAGNAYVAGDGGSSDFPTTPGAVQEQYGGGYSDVFLAKLSAEGNAILYSTYLGGSGDDYDYSQGLAIDQEGSAYLTGHTNSPDFPTVNPFQGKLAGGRDAFLTKITPAGDVLGYSSYIGGSLDDFGSAVVVDPLGYVYVTGSTSSTDFPVLHPFQSANAGGYDDVFVMKWDVGGSRLIYSSYLGGSGDDDSSAIALDVKGNVYVTGDTSSTNFPTKHAFQSIYGGGSTDMSITKIGPKRFRRMPR